ncbi:MAG: hypothetical protein GY856_21270 [bacterium]|nr:hypothetical protein [bacterium]
MNRTPSQGVLKSYTPSRESRRFRCSYDVHEVHDVHVDVPPEEAYAAVLATTGRERLGVAEDRDAGVAGHRLLPALQPPAGARSRRESAQSSIR